MLATTLLDETGDPLAREIKSPPWWPRLAKWSVNARYALQTDPRRAEELYEAVASFKESRGQVDCRRIEDACIYRLQ